MLKQYIEDNKYLFAVIVILLIFIGYLLCRGSEIKYVDKIITEECVEENIKVELKGAVVNPGVYELPLGSRVIDLINMGGGLLSDSNTRYINLSMKLKDEMVVIVYSNQDIEASREESIITKYIKEECDCQIVTNDSCINNNNSNLININSAGVEELTSLTGIGESRAQSIIDYRDTNGLFNSIEDIMNVSGIGESAFNKFKDYITI